MALSIVALALWMCSFVFSSAFVAGGLRGGSRAVEVLMHAPSYYDTPGFVYEKTQKAQADLTYFNDVGYFPDGTAYNKAGNAVNHPEEQGPDPHTPGSALPRAVSVNDVGYFPDGTAYNLAGNSVNHPEDIGPDPHTAGSALPSPLNGYLNDVGYTPDGTDMAKAGNLSLQ